MVNRQSSWVGVIFGLIAGASWGFAFLIPNMLSSFTSMEITLGRYFMYGLCSLLLFTLYKTNPLRISSKVWVKALLYAFIGNIGYFFFLVLGIKYAGATVATLINGIMPITISLFGNLLNREYPFKMMMIPACSILIGVVMLYYGEQGHVGGVEGFKDDFLLGLLCCVIALVMWTWYGISNANFLKQHRHLSANLFASIIGIQTLCLVVILLMISSVAGYSIVDNLVAQDRFVHYLIGVMVLGVVASWVATWAWNQTSKRLSVAIAGMVIVFETLFGLLYSYIYYLRLPTAMEWGSMTCIVVGVTWGIRTINAHKKPTLHA